MNDSTIGYIKNCKPALTVAVKQCQNISADETVETLEAKLALLEQKLASKYSRAYAFARA